MQHVTTPPIPESGGAFFNNPVLASHALAHIASVPGHFLIQQAFINQWACTSILMRLRFKMRLPIHIRSCYTAQLAIGIIATEGFASLRELLKSDTESHADIVMNKLRQHYNFSPEFTQILINVYDAAPKPKLVAMKITKAIRPGTNLEEVVKTYLLLSRTTAKRRKYLNLIEALHLHAPSQPVVLKDIALASRLQLT